MPASRITNQNVSLTKNLLYALTHMTAAFCVFTLGGKEQDIGSKQESDKLIGVNCLPAMDLQPATPGDGHQLPHEQHAKAGKGDLHCTSNFAKFYQPQFAFR